MNPEEIQALIINEWSGTINEEQQAHLQEVLLRNADARLVYEEMLLFLNSNYTSYAKNYLDNKVIFWDLIRSHNSDLTLLF